MSGEETTGPNSGVHVHRRVLEGLGVSLGDLARLAGKARVCVLSASTGAPEAITESLRWADELTGALGGLLAEFEALGVSVPSGDALPPVLILGEDNGENGEDTGSDLFRGFPDFADEDAGESAAAASDSATAPEAWEESERGRDTLTRRVSGRSLRATPAGTESVPKGPQRFASVTSDEKAPYTAVLGVADTAPDEE